MGAKGKLLNGLFQTLLQRVLFVGVPPIPRVFGHTLGFPTLLWRNFFGGCKRNGFLWGEESFRGKAHKFIFPPSKKGVVCKPQGGEF